ncbi:glycosyltransferase [Shewanella mangrovisoli]|uniref:glycosyltransferase n=1 Tax=Shewanella mangrovisoli TaxID=2864211 RepID=UPI0035B89FFD
MTEKISLVTSDLYDGGTATATFNYYKMFKGKGFDVKVYVLDTLAVSPKFSSIPSADIIRLSLLSTNEIRTTKLWSISNVFRVIKKLPLIVKDLNRIHGKVIFVHFLPILLAQLSFPFKSRCSYHVYTLHTNVFSYRDSINSFLKKIFFNAFLKLLRLGDRIVFLTSDVSTYYSVKYLAGNLNKVYAIPNAFCYDSTRKIFMDESCSYGIVYSGRLSPEKNVDFIIRSYFIYRQLGGKRKLTIAGDGECRAVLEHMVGNSIYSADINFLGQVDNIFDVYAKGEGLILASSNEGFGLVILEAISCGLPVVSSNCPSGPASIFEPLGNIAINTSHKNSLGILLPVPNSNEEVYGSALIELDSIDILTDDIIDNCLSFFSYDHVFQKWLYVFNGEVEF